MDEGFTVEQAAAANRALRDALGLPPERFGVKFVGMISNERVFTPNVTNAAVRAEPEKC